ncbi:phasin family protein [Variovorax rhizosphaerae]|uniref:Phasin family protein n=1 Tax=Variovorax rhizosphaerae TaxID=1836200 RepID=A0ABU8WJ31_9BURK
MPSPTAKKTVASKSPKPKTTSASIDARKVKAKEPATDTTGAAGENLLTVGLKVLGDARNHQNRVVESLLGIPKGTPVPARPAGNRTPLDTLGDTLGFRKLEDVFDQRIAAALVRLGIPTAEELASLRRQVNQLIEERDKALAQAQPRRKR